MNRHAAWRSLALATTAGALLAVSAARAERAVLYVHTNALEKSSFLDPDGVAGRRFADGLRAGWLADPASLDLSERDWLDTWATGTDASDVLVVTAERPSPQWRHALVGPAFSPIRVALIGEPAERAVQGLQSGHEPWISDAKVLRWEEVVELLELNRRENAAFRALSDPNHPLVRFREAFLLDKRVANLSLFLLATARPSAVGLHLELAASYERDVLPLVAQSLAVEAPRFTAEGEPGSAERRHAAEARFFAQRVRASAGRVYGRLDRIFQSLRAELAPGSIFVIDARDGGDPFVYVEIVGEAPATDALRAAWAEARSSR